MSASDRGCLTSRIQQLCQVNYVVAVVLCATGFSALVTQNASAQSAANLSVMPTERASYQSAFGVSAEEANENLLTQQSAAGIVADLKAVQGRQFAGVWFDNETGEFVVPIVGQRSAKSVHEAVADANVATDSRLQYVQYTWEELGASQEALDKELMGLLDLGLIRTSLNPRTNAILVEVASTATAAQRAEVGRAAAGATVEVEVQETGSTTVKVENTSCQVEFKRCDRPLRGGVGIKKGSSLYGPVCTAGFKAIGNTYGNRFMLTAGHCVVLAEIYKWYAQTTANTEQAIGLAEGTVYPGGDWTAINANGSYWDTSPWPSEVAFWEHGEETKIEAESASYIGEYVCHSGLTTGGHCGTVVNLNVTAEVEAGIEYHLAMFGPTCADAGDSGGPVFAEHVALGIISAKAEGSQGCGSDYGLYVEITEATDALQVSVGPRLGTRPWVETEDPIDVHGTEATLRGLVNPHGITSNYAFEYGTTAGYGSASQLYGAGSGWQPVLLGGTVSNLEPLTAYHFRIRGENSAGQAYGYDDEFSTSSAPPVVVTEAATGVGQRGATLHGTVNPRGADTHFQFEYGRTTAYGASIPVPSDDAGAGRSVVAESIAAAGLHPAATYHYRISATNSFGETSYGQDQMFTLEPAAPDATTLPAPKDETETSVTLKGRVEPNGLKTSYAFEYGWSTTYGSITSELDAGGGSEAVEVGQKVTGLESGTTYHYQLVAKNSLGKGLGGDQQVTTHGAPRIRTAPKLSTHPPYQGSALTVSNGIWSREPTSYSYRWQQCNGTGGECKDIPGAIEASYTPVEADIDHALVAKVTAEVADGSTAVYSEASGRVKKPIVEYPLPPESRPAGMTQGPDGNVWFVNAQSSKIGKVTTAGVITEYALPSGSEPTSITAGPGNESALWFTSSKSNKLGRITTSGLITEFSGPSSGYPTAITVGPDGNLWFMQTYYVDKMTTAGTITQYGPLPEQSSGQDIVAGSDGNMWFTNALASTVGKITMSGAITEYALPKQSNPTGITLGPDGNIWFSESGFNTESRIAKVTATGAITEYPLGGSKDPTQITAGPTGEGALWFTERGVHAIGRITTAGSSDEYSLSLTHTPEGLAIGADGNVWFTVRSGTVGRMERPSHPVAVTEEATSVGEHAATLHGTVNPAGEAAAYYFEYGPTVGYGSKTSEVSAGSGKLEVPVQQVISGLSQSATYHFRIVSASSGGAYYGADKELSTKGAPSVATGAATGLTRTERTLTGTVNPRGLETKYYFEYGTTVAYGSKTAENNIGSGVKTESVSQTISGLKVGVTYHFRVVAKNSVGTTTGSDGTFQASSWSVSQPAVPVGATSEILKYVSCVSSSFCLAVGTFTNAAGIPVPLAETWNGVSWAVTEPGFFEGIKESVLKSVSCVSPVVCVALGYFKKGTNATIPIAARWNGSSWAREELPWPAGATGSSQEGVSCVGLAMCMGVGSFRKEAVELPVAESWDGSIWHVSEPPLPAGRKSGGLEDVSCVSTTSCMAVGVSLVSGNHPIAERWNGFTWSAQEPPGVGTGKNGYLTGVSCTSATMCIAVGWSSTTAIAELWNGSVWTLKEAPAPSGSTKPAFQAVSCISAVSCMALGSFTNGAGKVLPLAETWNGTAWEIQEPPPGEGTSNIPESVGCAVPSSCLGVGELTTGEPTRRALGEIYR